MSRMVMTGVEYPWGSLGKVGPPKEDIDNLVTLVEGLKVDLLAEIKSLKDEVKSLRADILHHQRSQMSDFDEKSITSFMSLDDLGVVSDEPRPEVVPLSQDPDVRVISDSFTAPPPVKKKSVKKKGKSKKAVKQVLPNPFEGLDDDDVLNDVSADILLYLENKGPVMNNNLKRTGIIPEGAILTKKVKDGLKELVTEGASSIRYHKLDRMRGFYYGAWDDREPMDIYNQDISKIN